MYVTEPDLEFVIPLMLGLGVCACAVLRMGGSWDLHMLGKCDSNRLRTQTICLLFFLSLLFHFSSPPPPPCLPPSFLFSPCLPTLSVDFHHHRYHHCICVSRWLLQEKVSSLLLTFALDSEQSWTSGASPLCFLKHLTFLAAVTASSTWSLAVSHLLPPSP